MKSNPRLKIDFDLEDGRYVLTDREDGAELVRDADFSKLKRRAWSYEPAEVFVAGEAWLRSEH